MKINTGIYMGKPLPNGKYYEPCILDSVLYTQFQERGFIPLEYNYRSEVDDNPVKSNYKNVIGIVNGYEWIDGELILDVVVNNKKIVNDFLKCHDNSVKMSIRSISWVFDESYKVDYASYIDMYNDYYDKDSNYLQKLIDEYKEVILISEITCFVIVYEEL